VRTTTRNIAIGIFAIACWILSGGAVPAHAQAAAPQATGPNALALHVFQDAVVNARTTGARIAGPAPRAVPGSVQYQDALAKLQAGQLLEAQTAMQAALRLNPNSALYHGDLAAIQIGLQAVDEASLELVRARQIQAQNQFYTIALAAVKALRQQWSDASLNLDAAVSADSSIIDSTLAEAGVAWSWRARRNMQAMAWALVATVRYPTIAEPWLRLAAVYRQQRDTTRGLQAIERYAQLRPDDRAGQYIHAIFLYDLGRMDSAVVYAAASAQDSANREPAGVILYNIGARTFQAAQDTATAARVHQAERLDLAINALTLAKPITAPELAPRVALFLGYALLLKVAALDQQAEQNRACAPAQSLDSLLTRAGENLRAGQAMDSARVAPILSNTLPQYRVRAQALVNTICNARRP
jgi:predicted Zn-dependent protease